ncbi:MAG TPA: hypothetical protein VNL38_03015 [Candidatus Nitrosotenuis sp.]|nr:hypothetical protein [Candidatus Nitrosotenuis sp.]
MPSGFAGNPHELHEKKAVDWRLTSQISGQRENFHFWACEMTHAQGGAIKRNSLDFEKVFWRSDFFSGLQQSRKPARATRRVGHIFFVNHWHSLEADNTNKAAPRSAISPRGHPTIEFAKAVERRQNP